MGQTKDQNPRHTGVLGPSGLNGKSITDVHISHAGNVTAIEISYSGGSTFLKVRQGQIEIGGTIEWGSGTVYL